MRFVFLVVAAVIALASCSKPEPQLGERVVRPGLYSVEPSVQASLEQLAGEPLPSKFRSPLPLRKAIAIEDAMEEELADLRGAATQGDEALSRLIAFAAVLLERKGMSVEARVLTLQYQTQYAGMMYRLQSQLGASGDIGDYMPMLQWLDKWYQKLEGVFGPAVMRATRLEHLKLLNYSIPVVFHPRGYENQWWDKVGYIRHFAGTRRTDFYPEYAYDGFAGVVTYWAVGAACTVGTQGAGALPFLCSPVGDFSAYVMGKWPAPKIGERIFCRYNNCE